MGDRERRLRRRDKRRASAGKRYATVPIGGGMEAASPESILEALEDVPSSLDWPQLAPRLVPILPRRRPMLIPGSGELVEVLLPPGIKTGFGIDIGPAFLRVDTQLCRSWSVDPLGLVATSLENLRARLRPVRPTDLFRGSIDGASVRVLESGTGCSSALLLIEDELKRIFGTEPQVLIAPMRDILVSFAASTDRELVAWVNEEFGTLDPNGLALEAFALENGALRYEPLPRIS